MPAIGIVIAVVFVIIGGLYQQYSHTNVQTDTKDADNVLGTQPTITSSPTSEIQFPITQIQHPSVPSPSPSTFVRSNIELFMYPGSTTVSSEKETMILNSPEDPDAITQWYKTQIKSHGMKSTASATTSTNGNYFSKLAGNGTYYEISIEISKQNNDYTTRIIVTYHTY